MKIKKTDRDWLEGICFDFTDDVISLMNSYIKQTEEECKKKSFD